MQKKPDNILVIKPKKGLLQFDFKELWQYRELVYFFVWREIKIRYKQTAIGIMWAVFQPLCAMVIFTILFGKLGKMPSDGIPYPVFVYVGLLLWNYFSFGLSHASNSIVTNTNMIQKIYFPRIIIPVSSSLIGLVDLVVSLFVLCGIMLFYHYIPTFSGLLYLPVLIMIVFFSSVGMGCFLASLNVKYRDVQYAIPFFIQMFMFLTPVIYPVSIIKDNYKWLLNFNPMSAAVETARRAILGVGVVDKESLMIALFVSFVLFLGGVIYFRKTEMYFADLI